MQLFTNDFFNKILDVPHWRSLLDFGEIFTIYPSCFETPNNLNKGKVHFFINETKGNLIIEFVALKPKMYSSKVFEC